jgi:hypothetical protein
MTTSEIRSLIAKLLLRTKLKSLRLGMVNLATMPSSHRSPMPQTEINQRATVVLAISAGFEPKAHHQQDDCHKLYDDPQSHQLIRT